MALPPISPFSKRCSIIRSFVDGDYTTRFIDETPELFRRKKRRDRATKLLTYIGDVTVNGHPDTRNRPKPPAYARTADAPHFAKARRPREAASVSAAWAGKFRRMDEGRSRSVLITDTTMRDAHQSLLATRMRTHDIAAVADAYAKGLPELFSLECWGGATFDVAMRFLSEDPWERLRADPRARAQYSDADAAARRQRRRLHQLSR